jgi:subtilase family serine protease
MHHRSVTRRRALVLASAAVPIIAAGVAAAGPAGAATGRTPVRGTVPSWATRAASRGAASGTERIAARVYLAPRDGAGLTALVRAVSDPASPSYHHFLTHAQYVARFAPTSSQVGSIKAWLTRAGLHVDSVGAGNRYVAVSGDVAHAQKAFATRLERFAYRGAVRTAPATTVSVPSGLAVLTVTGLDGPHVVRPASQKPFPPPAGFRNAPPCNVGYGDDTTASEQAQGKTLPTFEGNALPYQVCGYQPAQLRAAYGSPGLDGTGATVAITDAYAAGTILADANEYATRHGDPAFAEGQFSQVLPSVFQRSRLCGSNGWYGEETLDVEAVHAIAPAANVIYYASASCFDNDFIDTLARVVDENKASIVTNSWSDVEANETPANTAAYESIFQEGATEGIGFFFSSGDDGDEKLATGIRQVDYPASDPYVTAVGGTSLAVTGTYTSPTYSWETGWGTDKYALNSDGTGWEPIKTDANGFLYGAGGGASALFDTPDYQKNAGVGESGARMVPDIGLDADPTTGMLVGETQTFPARGKDVTMYDEYRLGGTSLASPLMAGVQALATQANDGRLGFANYDIYALYNGGSSALRDITDAHGDGALARVDFVNGVDATNGYSYSVRTLDDDSSLQAGPGWDNVTGVGSPDAGYAAGVVALPPHYQP